LIVSLLFTKLLVVKLRLFKKNKYHSFDSFFKWFWKQRTNYVLKL